MDSSKAIVLVSVVVGLLAGMAVAVNIETVPVGDPGNAADTRYTTPGFGAVAYEYSIGKYEVTAGQYCEFLNKVAATDKYGLYNSYMGDSQSGCGISRSGSSGSYAYSVNADYLNRPVNYVSYWDACRFTNWLHNGQPTGAQGAGTTETGAYPLNGYNGIDGRTIHRSTGWKWAVTSEDEWYKAAYYKGGSGNAGYWDYPTGSNKVPGQDLDDVSGNNANYLRSANPIDSPYPTTMAGEFQNSDSPYGTFDQGGNVWEWNEAVDITSRFSRGGSFVFGDSALRREARYYYYHVSSYEHFDLGFRVVAIPEPTSMVILALAGAAILRQRRGRFVWARASKQGRR